MLLSSKHEANFTWALERLKWLLLRADVFLEVTVCDRYLALMNVINIIFLEASNLLCQFHINKNVKTKCKMLFIFREA